MSFAPGKRLPALCRDKVIRSAVILRPARLFFGPYPAAVQVAGKGKRRTVTGFLSYNVDGALSFTPYPLRANADAIPWTGHRPRLARLALRLIRATAYGHGAPGYIWDYPADHAAAIERGCLQWHAFRTWPQGGHAARSVLRRLARADLPRLAVFFSKLSNFISLLDPADGRPLPPCPPTPPRA